MSKKTWIEASEMRVEDMPPRTLSRYDAMFEDVMRRMKTANGKAIRYTFATEDEMALHYAGVSGISRQRLGLGKLRFRKKGAELYIWPGPNW